MPSLYRCRKFVVLTSEDDVLDNPPEYIVETGIDLDEIREVSGALGDEGEIFSDRCLAHFYNGDRVMVDKPFETLFQAWQEALNTAVLLRRFG